MGQSLRWGASIVLQLYREGALYSVWKMFEPDTDDYGLDLIVDPAGGRQWKDVTDLHHQRVEGRISEHTVLDVLAEAARVESSLEETGVWWAPWNDWVPTVATVGEHPEHV